MSIEWAREKIAGQPLVINERNQAEYSRTFHFKTNSIGDTEQTIRAHSILPKVGDLHPRDSAAVCRGLTFRRSEEQPLYWIVDAKYSAGTDPSSQEAIPWLQPVKRSGGGNRNQKILIFDLDGLPVVNAAGQRFEQPLEADDTRPTIRFERNERFPPIAALLTYKDAVNSDYWFGINPGCAKMAPITWTEQFFGGIPYYPTVYEMELKEEGWQAEVINQGSAYLNGEGILVRATDDFNNPIDQINLDLDGGRLEPGLDPTTIKFKRYKEVPFGDLGLV